MTKTGKMENGSLLVVKFKECIGVFERVESIYGFRNKNTILILVNMDFNKKKYKFRAKPILKYKKRINRLFH